MTYDLRNVFAFSTERDEALPCAVCRPHQTHGDQVRRVSSLDESYDPERHGADHPLYGVDALITDIPGLCIAVRTADCVPVLLHDPVHHAVAAIHAGWRGTVQHISNKTIALMHEEFGTQPSDLQALIGPCIGPDSFEVGEEVVEAFLAAGFPDNIVLRPGTSLPQQTDATSLPQQADATSLSQQADGMGMSRKPHIDLWAANSWSLEEAGVPLPQIRVAGIDTLADTRFFSARRETIHCGRITNGIRLED